MTKPDRPPVSAPAPFSQGLLHSSLSRGYTHVFLGVAILMIDLFTGRFLLFPILFVIPVALSAWFCSARLAFSLAVLLPVGRLCIAVFVDSPAPLLYTATNALIRVAVLVLIAWLVARTARQTRELQQRVDSLVTICAWSRTIEFQGEWVSFEEYLLRRFNINTSHGISPAEAEKVIRKLEADESATRP